jgi:hypothetical protein
MRPRYRTDTEAGLDRVRHRSPGNRQSRVSRTIRSRRRRSCAPAPAGLDRRHRMVAKAVARPAPARNTKGVAGTGAAGARTWAIALVRHRRRRAGSGRLLCRQGNRKLRAGPEDERDRLLDGRRTRAAVRSERRRFCGAALPSREGAARGRCLPAGVRNRLS